MCNIFLDRTVLSANHIISDTLAVCREEEISSFRPYYNPDTTSIKAPAGQGCPRCGGAVFAAEQQLAKGTVHEAMLY